MFEINRIGLTGLLELRSQRRLDERGSFTKLFHSPWFGEQGINLDIREQYVSTSTHGVVRGMHFQIPPHDCDKLVCCLEGEIFDVALDLRRGSPTYGNHASFSLSAERANMVYVPSGFAHGFCVLSDSATVLYSVSAVYAPEHDTGVRWDSAGISWPLAKPIVSERDGRHVALVDFASPFIYLPAAKESA